MSFSFSFLNFPSLSHLTEMLLCWIFIDFLLKGLALLLCLRVFSIFDLLFICRCFKNIYIFSIFIEIRLLLFFNYSEKSNVFNCLNWLCVCFVYLVSITTKNKYDFFRFSLNMSYAQIDLCNCDVPYPASKH